MRAFAQPPESVPEFHDDRVMITVTGDENFRSAVRSAGFTAALSAGMGDMFAGTLGASISELAAPVLDVAAKSAQEAVSEVLARYAEVGDVLAMTPVFASTDNLAAAAGAGFRSVAVALAASLAPQPKQKTKGLLAGTSIMRVREKSVRDQIVRELAPKPGVSATPVPRRYLQVRRPRNAPRAAAMPPVAAAVPPASGAAWHLDKTRTSVARKTASFVEPKKVKIAVLDTGIDETHPLLKNRVAKYFNAYPNLAVVSGPKDIIGHGTHVGGTIAAALDSVTGLSGMCECELLALKIFDDQTEFFPQLNYYAYAVQPEMYLRALIQCIEDQVQVANLSIGGPAPTSAQEAQLFNELISGGCTVVAAMGNEREQNSPISYPAAHPGVIAVGATDAIDRVARFSNRGPHISLCAPGQGIWSTVPSYPGQYGFFPDTSSGVRKEGKAIKRDVDYASEDGTSMASPQVAAAAAMYLARHPGASPIDVRTALNDSADKVAGMGGQSFHQDYGYGRLNVEALLR